MNRTFVRAVPALFASLALSSGVLAEDKPREKADINIKAGPISVEIDGGQPVQTKDRRRSGHDTVHRAADFRGLPIKNAEGENLGKVEDVVIDVQSGTVRYVAVSFGGFLGLGNKLFAVPWQAFECKQGANGKYYLVLNVEKEILKSAPGFDKDHWPDFANQEITDEIESHYKKRHTSSDSPRIEKP